MRDVVYDDFSGGHYVGAANANQPRSTWTGANAVCTADEGFLMADDGWQRSNLVTSAVDTPITQPIMYTSNASFIGTRAVFGVRTGSPGSRAIVADVDVSWPAITPGLSTTFTQTVRSVTTTSSSQIAWGTSDNTVLVWNAASPGPPTPAIVLGGEQVVQWGEFTLAWAPDTNRVRFSAPADPTSWPTTSFFNVSRPGSVITAILPAGDALYIGVRGEGWWAVTGVLGQTATLRRVNSIGSYGGAAESQQGIITRGSGRDIWLVRGGSTDTILAIPDDGEVLSEVSIGDAGEHVMLATDLNVWIWSDLTRRWRRKTVPAGYSQHIAFRDMSGNPRLYMVSYGTVPGGRPVYLHRCQREPLQPEVVEGAFPAATVRLAPFTNPTPFRVHEVIVEVDFGRPANQTPPRSLSCRIDAATSTDVSSTFSVSAEAFLAGLGPAVPPASSTLTRTWTTATATVNGHRETVRFVLNDGPVTHSAAPVLTIAGVKVRRVVLRYELV